MKSVIFELISNKKIAKNTYEWILSGDISDITAPGQFVNIQLDGFYLRRPISVCDAEAGKLTLIFKAVGEGTEKMAKMLPGAKPRSKTVSASEGAGKSTSASKPSSS